MADKNADFLVDNGVDYDKINFSTVANQVDYNGVSVDATLGTLSSKLEEHNHDGRYYTETEMNTKLAGKAEKNHTHPYLSTRGGTVDGDITVTGSVKMDTVSGNVKVNGNITMMKQGQMLCWSDENNKIQGRIYNNIITENNKKVQHFYILASSEANYAQHLGVQDGKRTLDPDHGDDTNNQLALGAPSHRWGQFYTYVAVNITSDRNEKENIEAIGDQYLDFFRGLKPVSYKLINGTSGRTHTGFIAQDVEEAMRAAGLTNMDFAGFCQDQKTEQVQKTKTVSATDPESGQEILEEMPYTEDVPVENEYVYSLRYEEFIALNTAMIQQLMKKSEEQKAVIAGLKDRISALEQRV